eukprot:3286126-Karenia_brevis.AAC.1
MDISISITIPNMHITVYFMSCQLKMPCKGHVRIMPGSCRGHVMLVQGSCKGHLRATTWSYNRSCKGDPCMTPE